MSRKYDKKNQHRGGGSIPTFGWGTGREKAGILPNAPNAINEKSYKS